MTSEFILSIVLAIGEFESNNNDTAIGKNGERGRHQITEAKWAETCERHKLPWSFGNMAHDNEASHYVCVRIVEDICEKNQTHSPRNIYASYNGGVHGFSRPIVQTRSHRFETLWKEKYDPKRKEKKK